VGAGATRPNNNQFAAAAEFTDGWTGVETLIDKIAMQSDVAIVGIAPDAKRHLQRDLWRTAHHRLVLPPLDATAIALVIEVLSGSAPATPVTFQPTSATIIALGPGDSCASANSSANSALDIQPSTSTTTR